MLNIALMGAGRIGKMHAKNIALHPMCNLSYVFDIKLITTIIFTFLEKIAQYYSR